MARLNAEAAKFAQAKLQQASGQNLATAVAKENATKEFVRTTVAVDMADVARQITRSSKTCAELQGIIAAQSEYEKKQPGERYVWGVLRMDEWMKAELPHRR